MRTIVVGDLHLARATPTRVSEAFASLLEAHAGTRVIVCGDLFDFSADHPRSSLDDVLGAHPKAKSSLARHLEHGELWLVSGNHDPDVSTSDLSRALGAKEDRIHTSPWFFRLGNVHVEHGHLFDPDNAPAHPLGRGGTSLGVHFVREFIAKTGAHSYLNDNDGTPLRLFLSTFTRYGKRAPFVIYQYFETAFRALARSGPFFEKIDLDIAELARAMEISEDEVRSIVTLLPAPTLASMHATFARLYLDRVIATLALTSGIVMRKKSLAALGAVGLFASWAIGHDRYGGRVSERLERGAADLRAATAADLVIFGHTHRIADVPGYSNTGSFAFPGADHRRPFLEIEGSRAVRRFF